MESPGTKISPMPRSIFASPTAGFLLKRRILAWTQETGTPESVHVCVDGKIFELHELKLVSKSGYFKRALAESPDVQLPHDFPGGSETFEMVALFSYDHQIILDPFNISALRCAAEFLEMTEDCASSNLIERSDLYLNQVVLQCWDDTLIVLQKCQALLPWTEELLVVSRCVESLAFMACMEILDPEQRRDQPAVNPQSFRRTWKCEATKEIAGQNMWIKDLIALPFKFFERIIGSLRRQGVEEKHVSPIIACYANKWVLSEKTHKFWENTSEPNGADDANRKVSVILEGIVELLPDRESRVNPVAFYFALLSRSLALSLSDANRTRLEDQVASLLHLAQVEDFLLPGSGCDSIELKTMERLVSVHLSSRTEDNCSGCTNLDCSSVVAELWDQYLSRIANHPELGPARFMELIQVVPMAERETHDHLYGAVNIFLAEHPNLSAEEKATVCKYLNCQKLSHGTCIQVVQNEQMPLRLVVQALLIQQLHTQQAFKDCSDSFRYTSYGEFSGRLLSSRCLLPESQNLGEKLCSEAPEEGQTVGIPLGSLLKKGIAPKRLEGAKEGYESASFRIQALEQELKSLKHSLQWRSRSNGSDQMASKTHSFRLFGSEKKAVDGKRKPVGHGSSCVGSLSWATQREYVSRRLVKIFSRITILRRGKSKIEHAASGIPNGSLACKSHSFHEMYDC